MGLIEVLNASGGVDILPQLDVQVRSIREDLMPWSEWIYEITIVKGVISGLIRLSGAFIIIIHDHFYFGTGPGRDSRLAVATYQRWDDVLLP